MHTVHTYIGICKKDMLELEKVERLRGGGRPVVVALRTSLTTRIQMSIVFISYI
jgi:hypothetical protein